MISSSIVQRARRGASGEPLPPRPLVEAARAGDPGLVLVIYLVGVFVSIVAQAVAFGFGKHVSVAVHIALYGFWAFILVLFISIGTGTSRGFALWGIALISALISAANIFVNVVALQGANIVTISYDSFQGLGIESDQTSKGVYTVLAGSYTLLTAWSITVMKALLQVNASLRDHPPVTSARARYDTPTWSPSPPVAPYAFPTHTPTQVPTSAASAQPPPPPPPSPPPPAPPPPAPTA